MNDAVELPSGTQPLTVALPEEKEWTLRKVSFASNFALKEDDDFAVVQFPKVEFWREQFTGRHEVRLSGDEGGKIIGVGDNEDDAYAAFKVKFVSYRRRYPKNELISPYFTLTT